MTLNNVIRFNYHKVDYFCWIKKGMVRISDIQNIEIDAYNYDLPNDQIAKYPLIERDSSKLLVYHSNQIIDSYFKSICDFLPTRGLIVFNNTKVIQARIQFRKETGAEIEIFCLEPYSPADYLLNFQQTQKCVWQCLVGNSKRWKDGCLSIQVLIDGAGVLLQAERMSQAGGVSLIEFSWNNAEVTFAELLDAVGELPIPPYLNRKTEESDLETYQTVYSKIIGSVAAPTAGLHFTPDVLDAIDRHGIEREEVTLHVGAGTFQPVKSEMIGDHPMHSELISVTRKTIQSLIANLGNIIAVGTTSVRTLESLYYLGVHVANNLPDSSMDLFVPQWMPYDDENNQLSVQYALNHLLNYLDRTGQDSIVAHTAIMIAPGYSFKLVTGIVTNFHQPKSTLLLLISAFVGDDNWSEIYKHALNNEYRFLSYGDSSLLLK